MSEASTVETSNVEDAATTLALFGRWWVTGIDEQARHPHVRRSIAADPVYARELYRDALNRARSLDPDSVRQVHEAWAIVRGHQKAQRHAIRTTDR